MPGDVQVDGGDGVARHPLDPVDVGAAVGDPAGDGGHRRGLERRADDRHVRPPAAAGLVVAGAAVDLDVHPEVAGGGLDGVAEPLPVPGDRDQHAEDQPAAEHDLLDVDDLDAGPREGGEDRGGDAGPVLAASVMSSVSGRGPRWSFIARHAIAGRGVGGRSMVDAMNTHTTPSTTSRSASPTSPRQRFYGRPSAGGSTTTARLRRHPGARRRRRGRRPRRRRAPGPGGVLVLVYSDDLDASLAAVEAAGGERRRAALRLPRWPAVHLRATRAATCSASTSPPTA